MSMATPQYGDDSRSISRLRLLMLMLASYASAISHESAWSEESGSRTVTSGHDVPSFYVRAVTGPLAGKSVCYVCRHGDRPVVMVLMRELGQQTTALLKELDQMVNRHRADGLRCFAVMLTGTPHREAPRLQTLAFDEKLDLPLTLAGEAVTNGTALSVDPEDAIMVVLYEDRRIVSQFGHRSGACDEVARNSIVSAAKRLAVEKRP